METDISTDNEVDAVPSTGDYEDSTPVVADPEKGIDAERPYGSFPIPSSVASPEIPEDEEELAPEPHAAPAEDEPNAQPTFDDDEPAPLGNLGEDTVDVTTIPLVRPEDQGPISQGTQHAVHLLRERFGGADSSQGSSQSRSNVLFQDMFPEETTSKADATKMFFEVLVLATKDAIKVDQPEGELGGPIKIRAKRGLWGTWAEEKAGGEAFGTQAESQTQPVAI